MDDSISQNHCNTCGIITEHNQSYIAEVKDTNSENEELIKIISSISCRGCKTTAIREDIIGPEHYKNKVFFLPPRSWARKPTWLNQLESIDGNIYALLEEIYTATNEQQSRLLAMGVRAALDHVMTHILGDIGGFERKLDEMVEQKYLSEKQKEMLLIVIDAGSAAVHRGYKPPTDLLNQMLNVTETIIRDYYITEPMLKTLKLKIPPRPPTKKA